jgi:hypothetical protein
MRPIQKWAVGHINPETKKAILEKYTPSNTARPDLEDNLGCYCGYCEVRDTTPEVEHTVSKDQDTQKEKIYIWENFILACSRCNGRGNKGSKKVDFKTMYFPDRNNTFMAFTYEEGGCPTVNSSLSPEQKFKAQALMDLVGLDKRPKELQNPKYPKFDGRMDKRWAHRRKAWEHAVKSLAEYEAGQVDAVGVANVAHWVGYFSVWFTEFMAHKTVKKALIDRFEGTALDCFDKDYNPIPRNPNDLDDPL